MATGTGSAARALIWSGGGTSRPSITGPGLAGPGFYDSSCPA